MNPLEQLCLDKADELSLVAELFLKQFDGNPEIKLIAPLTLLVAEYKTNRNLVEVMALALTRATEGESK